MSVYEKNCTVIAVPREHHEFAQRRIDFLLGRRALVIAKNDLSSLLAMAYTQGLADAAEVLIKGEKR